MDRLVGIFRVQAASRPRSTVQSSGPRGAVRVEGTRMFNPGWHPRATSRT